MPRLHSELRCPSPHPGRQVLRGTRWRNRASGRRLRTPGLGEGVALGLHQLLGVVICFAAGYVVVKSIRDRRQTTPLPVVLIAFGVLFDLVIAEGRTGEGVGATTVSYYTMPNLILFLGIVVYAWRHLPRYAKRSLMACSRRRPPGGVPGLSGRHCDGNRHQRGKSQASRAGERRSVLANLHRVPAATGAASSGSSWQCLR